MADLDRERIAAAALAIADERGAEGFTMRAVADRLGVTPMALYHHVADKAALVALVVEAVIVERPLPPATGVWRDDLWEVAHWLRRSTQDHPAVSQLNRAYRAWTPKMLSMTERWLSVWQQSGLTLEQAVEAATVSSLAIYGYLDSEVRVRTVVQPDEEMLALLPNARLLLTSDHDPEAEFELMVRALVEGLHTRLTTPAGLTGEAARR